MVTTIEPNVPGSSEHRPRARERRLMLCVAVAVAALVLDQVSKAIVRARLQPGETWPDGWELIRFSHVHNSGAAFGIMQDATTFLTIASFILGVVLVIAIYRLAATQPRYALLLSLVLGGALGNLIERLRLGYVTDFIDPMRYPSFNLADSWIVIGVAAMILLSIFERDDEPVAAAVGPDARTTHREPEATR